MNVPFPTCPAPDWTLPTDGPLVFVCSGNICRSPIAEALFHHLIPAETEFYAESAGTYAYEGNRALSETIAVGREMGLDLSGHRAQPVTPDLIRRASCLFTMATMHAEAILSMAKDSVHKVIPLGCFASENPSPFAEIEDPYGFSMEEYRRCFAEIRDCIENLITRLPTAPE